MLWDAFSSLAVFSGVLSYFRLTSLMPNTYFYLILNGLILLFPLVRSFEPRLQYARHWKYLFPSIWLVMLLFIPWDIAFTRWGVWGFTPTYLSGIYLLGLPLEEWIFFVSVPFACVFIYESLVALLKVHPGPRTTAWVSNILITVCLLMAILFTDRWYTVTTFGLNALFLILAYHIFRFPFLGRIYLAYLFVLLPFLIFNGLLTGAFIPEQVVWYNDAENLGIRLGTIPVEDAFYGFFLVGLNTTLYLLFQKRVA